MSSQLTQSLTSLLALASIASVVSSLFYFPFRFLESRSRIACGAISLSACVWLYFVASSRGFLLDYRVALFAGLIGTIFHLKSRAKSTGFISSLLMMSAVSVSTASVLGTFFSNNTFLVKGLYHSANFYFMGLYPRYNAYIVELPFEIVIAQSITPPFLVWAWTRLYSQSTSNKHLES